MAELARVILFHGPDGAVIGECIREKLARESFIRVDADLEKIPKTSDNAVAVYILTPESEQDARLAGKLAEFRRGGMPVIPVVNEVALYKFSSLPPALNDLSKQNAVGWNDGKIPGERVLAAIRNHLGLTPQPEACRLFISYSRVDQNIAQEAYQYLHDLGYWVFLDTERIGGGQDVQPAIFDAIKNRDFVLLLDSPDSARSKWVQAEVEAAVSDMVPIGVLRLNDKPCIQACADLPSLRIQRQNFSGNLEEVRRFVDSLIASKETFTVRCMRTLHDWAKLKGACLEARGKRRYIFYPPAGGSRNSRPVLIEFEDTGVDLRRLYRLHCSFEEKPRKSGAVFIHNGLSLSEVEKKSMTWAVRREPLCVAALCELQETLDAMIQ